MHLSELFDLKLHAEMLEAGYVKAQTQPGGGTLAILNYTPSCQYDNMWNDVTRQCRGLIVDVFSGEVVARPFPKFFNYEQVKDEIPVAPFSVSEKMDGSLGILYPVGGTYKIATRGSFASDQALHATRVLHTKYSLFEPPRGFTYLFEIIYPENRIVVNYEGQDDLVLIDVIHNETGQSFLEHMEQTWPGPIARQYVGYSWERLLAEQRENAEGFVIKFDNGLRVKVKHDEYVRLHRIVTGVSRKTIWRYLSEDGDTAELLDRVPDEFYQWVKRTISELKSEFHIVRSAIRLEFENCLKKAVVKFMELPPAGVGEGGREFRKRFAGYAASSPYKGELFALLDEKSIDEAVWKRIVPTAERPFTRQSEDAN